MIVKDGNNKIYDFYRNEGTAKSGTEAGLSTECCRVRTGPGCTEGADEPYLRAAKGVRRMVLFTCNKKYGDQAVQRLESQGIPYILQPVGRQNVNVYFGRRECMEAIKLIVTRPLNQLSPEEDFILGAMLGYDICAQCERYCKRKS